MRRPRPATVALTAAILTTTALVCAPGALAASGDAIGTNLGDLLREWAQSLFGAVAGIVGLVFLINRRYQDLALFMCAAVLVGGLVFAPTTVAAMIEAIWKTIGA